MKKSDVLKYKVRDCERIQKAIREQYEKVSKLNMYELGCSAHIIIIMDIYRLCIIVYKFYITILIIEDL